MSLLQKKKTFLILSLSTPGKQVHEKFTLQEKKKTNKNKPPKPPPTTTNTKTKTKSPQKPNQNKTEKKTQPQNTSKKPDFKNV